MSWNFNHTGTRAGVIAAVALEKYVPASVKTAISDVINAPTQPNRLNGIKVESHGHVDEFGGSLKIEITQVGLLMDPPTPVVEAAPPDAASTASSAPTPAAP